ncbi:hypothetical protein JK636_19155 [Clostridium sp. YIM B02515]|uniref:SGNH hydrolase-type esterase domain-containing protein n=1 Tax=Clostridium rhizosphaerae TaxID=2803861 RepID=A0ABS1TEM4_9CLOT|nr:SGNH/GDSL hydrolase family protein [Clostridium rhizosphaerae]MBL4937829.1 hypothetical protein [Clostridium rhizosphaerae]
MKKWICTWSLAHSNTVYMPWNDEQKESSITIKNNIAGEKIRLKFSNNYGKKSTKIKSVIICINNDKEKKLYVSVDGKTSFTLLEKMTLISDDIDFLLEAGDELYITMVFEERKKPESGCEVDNITIPCLEEVDIYTEETPKVIVAFGDSITRLDTWTRPLANKLYAEHRGKVTFSNKGISGNRLMRDCAPLWFDAFGDAAVKRLKHDVLDIPGVTHVIFALGTNDLGHPGEVWCSIEELPTLEEFVDAVKIVIKQIKIHNIKLIGTTILPRLYDDYWTIEKEKLRRAINHWIVSSGEFYSVLDFDKVVHKKNGEPGMMKEFDSGDGLHPSEQGGLAIMKSINTEIFF